MRDKQIRICLIATEYKGIGAYGGFGVLTFDIATGLAAQGIDVYVAMERKKGQAPIERMGDVTIVSYPTPLYAGIKFALPYAGIYRMIDADIYHSEEPSLATALAQIACPQKKHLVTFQDPRNLHDWTVEWAHNASNKNPLLLLKWKIGVLKWYIRYQLETGRAARKADGRYCQAKFIIEKARKMYRLNAQPEFLPNPIRMAKECSSKASVPTVCYVGRWDERKRPELFMELAGKNPSVKFIAAGGCLNNEKRDKELRARFNSLKNVEVPGWLAEKERAEILDRAWILINTSTRECLPVTYLEAGAQKCAILSHCDADDFASNFGYWAKKGDLANYEQGLSALLKENQWKNLGQKAYDYVLNTHEYNRVINQHLKKYEHILGRSF